MPPFDRSQIASSLTTQAQCSGARDVGRGDREYALPVDVIHRDLGVEGDAGQDCRLGRGVKAGHVRGRVCLGVAERLRLRQRRAEVGTRGVHPVEDEVGGAVHDPEHPADLVACQRLAERPQQRDRAGHRRLVVQVSPGLACRLVQHRAVRSDQRLVRGDHGLPGAQCRQQQGPGRLDPADQLDHDVHVRPGDQVHAVSGQQVRVDRDITRPVGDADRHARDLQRRSCPGLQVSGLLGKQPVDLRSDDTAAKQCHPERCTFFCLAHACILHDKPAPLTDPGGGKPSAVC